MNQNKAKQLVAEAKKNARQADSWIILSNALTDPNGGLIARYFPDANDRQAFLRSPQYEQLNRLLVQSIAARPVPAPTRPEERVRSLSSPLLSPRRRGLADAAVLGEYRRVGTVAEQVEVECLVILLLAVALDFDGDGLRRLAGGEGQRAGLGDVVVVTRLEIGRAHV